MSRSSRRSVVDRGGHLGDGLELIVGRAAQAPHDLVRRRVRLGLAVQLLDPRPVDLGEVLSPVHLDGLHPQPMTVRERPRVGVLPTPDPHRRSTLGPGPVHQVLEEGTAVAAAPVLGVHLDVQPGQVQVVVVAGRVPPHRHVRVPVVGQERHRHLAVPPVPQLTDQLELSQRMHPRRVDPPYLVAEPHVALHAVRVVGSERVDLHATSMAQHSRTASHFPADPSLVDTPGPPTRRQLATGRCDLR